MFQLTLKWCSGRKGGRGGKMETFRTFRVGFFFNYCNFSLSWKSGVSFSSRSYVSWQTTNPYHKSEIVSKWKVSRNTGCHSSILVPQ